MSETISPSQPTIEANSSLRLQLDTTVDSTKLRELRTDDIRIHTVQVTDEYEKSAPVVRENVAAAENQWCNDVALLDRPSSFKPERVFESNIASQEFYHPQHTSIREWRRLVPSALALYPLQNPHVDTLPNGYPLRDEERGYFALTTDALGLRSRGAVFSELMQSGGENNNNETQKWLSLAGGAADPVMKAAAAMEQTPEITLVDYDDNALAFAQGLANEAGVEDSFKFMSQNLTQFDETMQHLGGEAALGSFDAVDILGFFEYLPDDYGENPYNIPISTEEFLSYAYGFVKPGGKVVFGNMLDTHPALDFTTKVVGWPFIQPRSIDQIVDIVGRSRAAEASLDIYLPDDGVYAIAELRKPAPSQNGSSPK